MVFLKMPLKILSVVEKREDWENTDPRESLPTSKMLSMQRGLISPAQIFLGWKVLGLHALSSWPPEGF